MSLVDSLVDKHLGFNKTGVQNQDSKRSNVASEDAASPFEWSLFDTEMIFAAIVENSIRDDVELCAAIRNYIIAISSKSDKIAQRDIGDGSSRLWFNLLHRLGWLKADQSLMFTATDSELKALTIKQYAELTEKWKTETGIDWKDWFKLLCYLRSAKMKIIKELSNVNPNDTELQNEVEE